MDKKRFLLDEIAKGRDKVREQLLTATDKHTIGYLHNQLDNLLLHYINTLNKRA